MKYYILFGPPGAGKGTQATAMVEKYNLHHISTGALLRKEIAAGTELGLQAKSLIEQGCLVPDEVVEGMIESEFKTVTGAPSAAPAGRHQRNPPQRNHSFQHSI